jgi:signal peptidase II
MTADRSGGPPTPGSFSTARSAAPPSPDQGASESAAKASARRPHWLLFGTLAGAVVVADQVSKAWIMANVPQGQVLRLIGDELRLVVTQNTGGVFGLFRDQAPIFAAVSIGVMGLIVVFHGRSPASRYLTLTLGLLLGGAIGNFVDRVRLGYVIDFVDAGIGTLRFYTFNVADMAVSASVVLLIALSLRTSLGGGSGDAGDGR